MHATTDDAYSRQPLLMRVLVRRSAYRHPRAWGGLCLAAGAWVLILGAILCADALWWGAALVAVGALELWVASRLLHPTRG
jgi:hypothetical protein